MHHKDNSDHKGVRWAERLIMEKSRPRKILMLSWKVFQTLILFANMGRKKYDLILLLTKMIEALVQVSSWKVHIFQHFKTWEWVFFQRVENDETMEDLFVTTSQIWSFKIYFIRPTWEVQLKWKLCAFKGLELCSCTCPLVQGLKTISYLVFF